MCDECDWESTIETIDELLESGDADWAADTLEGIRETVAEREHCTERQEEAVENITAKARR
jgi:hypothetical protein